MESLNARAPPTHPGDGILWLLMILLTLVLLSIAVHSVLGEPINITSGANYTYNYTNQTNETASQDFLCLPNVTLPVNVSVSLQPGESRITTQDVCQVTASCAASNVTVLNGTCSIDTTVKAGEVYENRGSACNVRVQCDEDAITTVSHTKHYKLTGDGETITFEFDGKEQPFSRNSTSFTYEADITYDCPVEVTKETFEGDELLQLCKEVNPYLLGWVDDALKRGDACAERKTTCEESLSSCETQCTNRVDALRESILGCQNSLNNTNGAFNRCLAEKQEVESKQWVYTAVLLFLGMYGAIVTVVLLFMGYALWKNRRNKGDAE